MYSLVCFENEELYVCEKHYVSEVNNKISAKYKNKGSYRAKYVVYDGLGDNINSTLHSSYDNNNHEIPSGCDDTFADSTLSVDSMNPTDPDFVMEDSVETSQNLSNCGLNFADD
ncbi:hypothetical protein WA026_014226 [Henosepilachna vigintioctopunctata]|uniref:Uncharacterized protein n=1 Tax=Henosepilachna vigintioctopunctata TaxID=420089 RepID=A0AAW1TVL9_9CUCU